MTKLHMTLANTYLDLDYEKKLIKDYDCEIER